MQIRFFNSLTNTVENFEPVESGTVRMYSCGPTVYDYAHIGNFRSFLFSDLLRRFLEVAGYDVIHVMNITDVGHMTEDAVADGGGEDKMELAGRRLKEDKKSGKVEEGAVDDPSDPFQVARFYTDSFLSDGRQLGLKVAGEYPGRMFHATEHIGDMQAMIADLIDKGHAYVADDGVVYYSVESFPEYGRLSGNTLDNLQSGAGGRVLDEHQDKKKHPADFMLWKADSAHIMKWDSPWGEGYPGWHIECSAMARAKLERDVIDIHTGGEDLIFPHHECEIAQSRGATGADSFAKFWMHVRFLLVEGEKMSKSQGNFYTVRDVLDGKSTGSRVHPAVLRYELTKSNYRKNMNFTAQGLQDSATAVRRLNDFVSKLEEKTGGEAAEVDNTHPVLEEFFASMADDLNVAGALGALLPWASVSRIPDNPHEALAVMRKINQVLAVAPLETQENGAGEGAESSGAGDGDAAVAGWCRELDAARADKDYEAADRLRDQIIEAGYDVSTSPEGTIAKKRLA